MKDQDAILFLPRELSILRAKTLTTGEGLLEHRVDYRKSNSSSVLQ